MLFVLHYITFINKHTFKTRCIPTKTYKPKNAKEEKKMISIITRRRKVFPFSISTKVLSLSLSLFLGFQRGKKYNFRLLVASDAYAVKVFVVPGLFSQFRRRKQMNFIFCYANGQAFAHQMYMQTLLCCHLF